MPSSAPDVPARLRPVLLELLEGKPNAEIAEACPLTVHTVEKYVSDLLAFFECRTRGELIARALRGDFGDLNEIGEVSG